MRPIREAPPETDEPLVLPVIPALGRFDNSTQVADQRHLENARRQLDRGAREYAAKYGLTLIGQTERIHVDRNITWISRSYYFPVDE